MKIKMTGIDHSNATLAQREVFAFTSPQVQSAMRSVVKTIGVNACVIVSTCNRTEIWISEGDDQQTDLAQVLCELKNINLLSYKNQLVAREGLDAVRHLFETACGLKSQIWGEDQILGQIKSSIEFARNAETTDEILEKLFQTAITAAKKIKTEMRLTPFDVSVATKALEKITKHFSTLSDLDCLVIGNGEVGRMISSLLVNKGANVTITRRKHKNGTSVIPEGCYPVQYEERFEKIKQAKLIVSATSSPHYTIRMDDIAGILSDDKPRFFIDLAVPRDIDPDITDFSGVILMDSDDLGCLSPDDVNIGSLILVRKIIEVYIEEFIKWEKAREYLPIINNIAQSTSEKIRSNLSKEIKELSLNDQQRDQFEQKLDCVTTKAIRNVLFMIKDNLDNQHWEECFGNLDMIEE